jgi:hypothetical protein
MASTVAGMGDTQRGVGMRRNLDKAFVGVQGLKAKHRETLVSFRASASAGEWMKIHRDHYDWWMFPIDEPSGYGLAYTVFGGDVLGLRGDAAYMAEYLEGASILARAWGWSLEGACPVAAPAPGQRWQNWPIRLYKATKSLKLFGCEREYASFRVYGQRLLAAGVSFEYTRDLTWLFNQYWGQVLYYDVFDCRPSP